MARGVVSEGQSEILWMQDICRFLNRDEKVVRHMIARRTIPTRRLGRRVFALREDLEAHLRGLPVQHEL
jgi:hypothetical protein